MLFRSDCGEIMMYKYFWKRILDIVLSLAGIIVLAVPMLIIAVIIKIDSPGPVFFKQKRIGINKSYFNIIKFRSMPVTAPHDTPTHQLKNAEDILSPFQKMIRRLSIDELPQLFCIFTSKMSVIGPRPALWNQDDLIAPQALAERYKIQPEPEESGYDLLTRAGRKRGFVVRGGEIDTERMARALLDEFRDGRLGRFTLEAPEELENE